MGDRRWSLFVLLLIEIETYHSASLRDRVMPRRIDGKTYYEAREVCEQAGISRPTLFRWLKRGLVTRLHRDRRGWRLFTEEDLSRIQGEASRIEIDHFPLNSRGKGTQITSKKVN
jgi:hypothetical protein